MQLYAQTSENHEYSSWKPKKFPDAFPQDRYDTTKYKAVGDFLNHQVRTRGEAGLLTRQLGCALAKPDDPPKRANLELTNFVQPSQGVTTQVNSPSEQGLQAS